MVEEEHEARITRLEEWRSNHEQAQRQGFKENKEDHDELKHALAGIYGRLNRIEGKLMYAAGVVSVTMLIIGGIVGLITTHAAHIWRWLVHP